MDPELQLYQVLRFATDADVQVVRKAQEQLLSWEQHPGFFVTLTRICFTNIDEAGRDNNEKLDVNARWMAAVYLKNAINKYWKRSGRQFELPDSEKQQIRMILLNNFACEPIQQVAVQVAVLIGRIARMDFPREWPELLPFILERLQKYAGGEANSLILNAAERAEQQRFLMVQLHVIKAIASRRFKADKMLFEDLTSNIFPFVQRLWNDFTSLFFQQLPSDLNGAFDALTRAHLTLRMLRKMSTYGYTKRHKFECGHRFFEQLFVCMEQCLQCRYEMLQHLGSDTPFMTLFEKFILKQMKILNDFQEMHASAFARYLPTSLEFSFQHVFHERARLIFTENEINFPNFAIQCINLMKGVMLSCHFAGTSASHAVDDDSYSYALSDFFTKERLSYICDKIITHYFLLTRGELEKWDDDPEIFAQDDGGERYRYELRPCVESFYLTCFNNNQTTMVADVVKFVEKAQQITLTESSDLKDILLKDAIYNAVGLNAFHFYNDIDFNQWFTTQLLAELRIESNNFRILRRRIIWLVSEFAPVKFSRDLRPLAYEACLHLLRQEEDMSVRLAASRTLCTLIGDFEFAPMAFLPYLEPAFNSLFLLLVNAKECETKMTVLSSMSVLVETMNDHIEPVADKLIAYLPLLWKESEEFQMLRCSIIFALQQIVRAINDVPDSMKSFLYEVVQFSTDVEQPAHIYLIEEGLILWVAVVENSTSLTPSLLNLCKQLQPIVEMSSEHLRTIFVLVQGYILLDAHAYLESYGQQFVEFCQRLFYDIRAEGIVYMMKVLETCLKAEPRHGLQLLRPILPPIFEEVYKDESFPMVLSMNLMMLARTLLIDQVVFTETVQSLQQPDAMEKIFDVWITKMPLVRDLDKRKLYCLSFASILSSNHRILHERFAGIIQNISDALNDIMEEEDCPEDEEQTNAAAASAAAETTAVEKSISSQQPKKYYDSLLYVETQDFDTSGYCTMENFLHDSHHYERCRQLSLKDPVHQIALNEYVNFQLDSMRQQLRDEAYKRLWETVPAEVRTSISRFIRVPQ